MFVMSEKFIEEHSGNLFDITIYGQESNQTIWKFSRMNLAIRKINSQFVSWNTEGSFLKDAHPDLKADYILANPPFNQKDWGNEILTDDGRWKYGIPPKGNANFAWIQHMLYHLSHGGVMSTVLANGSLSSKTSGDEDIKKITETYHNWVAPQPPKGGVDFEPAKGGVQRSKSPLGDLGACEIPKGWRVGKLSDIADFLNGLALQKYPPRIGEDNMPVIKIKELKNGITLSTDRANRDIDKKYILKNGDIIFSWSGSLEVEVWKYGEGALNQHLFKVTSDSYQKWFYYFWLLVHLNKFRSIASSKATTMGHIQRKHLDEALVLIPSKDVLLQGNKIFSNILNKIETINEEIQTLSKTRDTILPKLMSGEIRIKGFGE